MVEYHIWSNIRLSTDGENELGIERVIKQIESLSKTIYLNNKIFNLKAVNGEYILSINGVSNHLSEDVKSITNLFYKIPKIAKGSYGLMHIWNDEDLNANNKFKVYRMARGKIDVLEDAYLSPCEPIIED